MGQSQRLDEPSRLASLRQYAVLDTASEPSFDRITRLVARQFHAPMVLISFVDETRLWFKSRLGIDIQQTNRDVGFCTQAILGNEVMVVCNAVRDPRFAENPLVTHAPHIRFYAGAPLTTPDSFNLGTICFLDNEPRPSLSFDQREILKEFADLVVHELESRQSDARLREAERELQTSDARFRAFMDNSPALAFIKDEAGRVLFCNQKCRRLFEMGEDLEWPEKSDSELWPPDVAESLRAVDHTDRRRVEEQLRQTVQSLKKVQTDLRSSLEEKEVLLKEIHHRVKNNMQVISSLLNMQAMQSDDTRTQEMFRESRNRVLSMAAIHEQLYKSVDLARVNLEPYLKQVISNVFCSFGGADSVAFCVSTFPQPLFLKAEKAIPVGLIINELVSNSLKHALPSGSGKISVAVYQKERTIRMIVQDDGRGFPPEFKFPGEGSLGLQLVDNLVRRQLAGELLIDQENGTLFRIWFRLEDE